MTECYYVNTHTVLADGAMLQLFLLHSSQARASLLPPHPFTPSVLSSLVRSSARESVSTDQTAVCAPLPALNLLQQDGKRYLLVFDVTRAAGSQLCRWAWKIWYSVLCIAQTHEPTVSLREDEQEKRIRISIHCIFSRYSTAFDIEGLHLVQLLLGRLKPY